MHITIRVSQVSVTLEAGSASPSSAPIFFFKKPSAVDFIYDLSKISQKYTDKYSLNNKELRDVSITLRKVGQEIAKDLFGDEGYQAIKNYFAQYSNEIPIQIIGKHDFWIPWELLYVGEGQRTCLEDFLGFNRNIYRIFPFQGLNPVIFKELKVGFLAHEKVAFCQEEFDLLESYERTQRVNCVKWSFFADKIGANSLKLLDVLHVSGLVLPVMYLEKSAILVNEDFLFYPSEIFDQQFKFKRSPFIILNLRDSYLRKPKDIMDYVNLLMKKHKVAGVIASELPIPARLAMEFSKRFYKAFLKNGLTFSNALKQAKVEMLEGCHNPFAMFYTPYAYVMEKDDERWSPQTSDINNHEEKNIMIIDLLTTATVSAGVKFVFDRAGELWKRLNEEQLEKIKSQKASIEKDAHAAKKEKDMAKVQNIQKEMKELVDFLPQDLELDTVSSFISWGEKEVFESYDNLLGVCELTYLLLTMERGKIKSERKKYRRLLDMITALKKEIENYKDTDEVGNSIDEDELHKRLIRALDMLKKITD